MYRSGPNHLLIIMMIGFLESLRNTLCFPYNPTYAHDVVIYGTKLGNPIDWFNGPH